MCKINASAVYQLSCAVFDLAHSCLSIQRLEPNSSFEAMVESEVFVVAERPVNIRRVLTRAEQDF